MFSDEDRAVFEWSDGKKTRFSDPLALRRRLVQASHGDYGEVVKAAMGPEQPEGAMDLPPLSREEVMAMEAGKERLLAVVREAFELPEVNPETGEGVTEAICWKILGHYSEWLEKNGS